MYMGLMDRVVKEVAQLKPKRMNKIIPPTSSAFTHVFLLSVSII